MSVEGSFHIDVVDCNYVWVEKNIGQVPIQSSHWCLYYSSELTAALEYEGQQTLLEPSWLYLVPPETKSYATLISSSYQLVHYFSISTYQHSVEPGIYKIPIIDLVVDGINILIHMNPEQRLGVRGQGYSHFLINYALVALDAMFINKTSLDSRVQKAMAFLNLSYSENININDIANNSDMSRESFSRLFKKHVGKSPYQHLINLRMNKAKLLLSGTNQPVKHIALSIGFKDQYQFSRLFKQWNGLSPSFYRNSTRPTHSI